MTTSTISAVSTVVASATASASTGKLVKLASGEYTAASVTADPTDAAKLALVKERDGNYGTAQSADATSKVASTTSAATRTSSAGLAALTTLTLGGV